MEQLQAQIVAVTDELNTLRAEIIGVKTAHASLHQDAVTHNAAHLQSLSKIQQQMDDISQKTQGAPTSDKKPLIEPKSVEVKVFAGSMADDRAKFLSWTDKLRDRVALFDPSLVKAMALAAKGVEPITAEMSVAMGVTAYSSAQLHGLLKDKTESTALQIVRGNHSEVDLESWRLLYAQYYPQALQSTITAEHLEHHPRPANKVSELPARLAEWDQNLRRCIEEATP